MTDNRTICIYHAHCADGFTAAWAVREALGNRVEFIPAGYGDVPPDVTGADVIIVDFSYKRPVIDAMAEQARSILILDHHKTAEGDLSHLLEPPIQDHPSFNYADLLAHIEADPVENVFAIFDMNRSGAQLAWDFFNEGARPMLVEYVSDRDLWRWAMEDSLEINAVIGSHDLTWHVWDDLSARMQADEDIWMMSAEGAAIIRYQDKLVRQIIDTSMRRMEIAGHYVPVAAAPYALASDVAGTLADGEPFAATYVDGPKGRAFSLRSRGDDGLDVAQIAAKFGGGGHRNAAGFRAPHDWEGDA
ncbi:DHHA1 domain-containing protein [Paenirhodobacter sp. CAU 1674]|uniref:DHHA1 domain-containing protein n=1 Tax=Paenirhodobacter sp. CAU 1674 TaxID=3032596 RepID=UPI0023DB70E7|nr:DHHA1 domain-containing protein [Paenirhodobacter sp. CAU 1674]MDF2140827.1 DHHA1 domain-containing protein [Paenirhodobacter sp. CAU 1674]